MRSSTETTHLSPRLITGCTVLQIGRNYQAFLDYGALRYDSIWNASVKARKTYGEFEAEKHAASKDTFSHLKLIFDRSKGMINAHEKIFISAYHYTEPIPQLQWTMARGDSTVLGYPCHKATTHFRGRDYIAWYTEEIPFPYGPFKFGGLPGLITCIYDTQREAYLYACRLRESPVRGLHLRASATPLVRDHEGSAGEAAEVLPSSSPTSSPPTSSPQTPGTRPSSASPSPTIRSN